MKFSFDYLRNFLADNVDPNEIIAIITADIKQYVHSRKQNPELFAKEVYKWDLVRKWYKRDIETVADLREWVSGNLYDPSSSKKCVNNLIIQSSFGDWQDDILKGQRGNDNELASAMQAMRVDNFSEIQALPINNWKNRSGQRKKIDLRIFSTYLMCHDPFNVMQYKDKEFQAAREKWKLSIDIKSNGFAKWQEFAKKILLPLLAEEMNVNIAEPFDFSNLDIEKEIDAIREGKYLCMIDVQDFVWMRFHSFSLSAASPMIQDIETLLKSSKQLIVTGAPGTGKTFTAIQLAEKFIKDCNGGTWGKVQFHPGYDYSDFIIGLKPEITKSGDVTFDWKNGIFKKFSDEALKEYKANGSAAKPYIFIIDEINRADLSRVFGEVFSLLEEEYRYPNKEIGITLPNGENFILPDNLYIIGTMNDIDRSVESMDFALRRRFSWLEVKAEDSEHIIDAQNDKGNFKITEENDRQKLKNAMNQLNKYIGSVDGKAAETLKVGTHQVSLNLGDEYQLGGAYFLNFAKYQNEANAWQQLWDNHIAIILNEYLRGNNMRSKLMETLFAEYDKVTNQGSK